HQTKAVIAHGLPPFCAVRCVLRCFSNASEKKPQPELNLTGAVGGRIKRLSDGPGDSTTSVEERLHLSRQVGIVQDIKHLYPELGLHLLAPQVLVLEHGEIQVTEHRHGERIPAQVPQYTQCGKGEAFL